MGYTFEQVEIEDDHWPAAVDGLQPGTRFYPKLNRANPSSRC